MELNRSKLSELQEGSLGTPSISALFENIVFFRKQFYATVGIVVGLFLTYAFLSTPIYVSETLIQVEDKKESNIGALNQISRALNVEISPVYGEIDILRSRVVVGQAVEQLRANIDVDVLGVIPFVARWLARILPEEKNGLIEAPIKIPGVSWGGEVLRINQMIIPEKYIGKPLFLKIGEDQNWQLHTNKGDVVLTGKGVSSTLVSDDGLFALSIKEIIARPGDSFKIIFYRPLETIQSIQDALITTETKKGSNIIRASYEYKDPIRAQAIMSAIANNYVQANTNRRSEEASRSLEFLNNELPRLKEKLEIAESNLTQFRRQNNAVDIPTDIKELLAQSTNLEKIKVDIGLKLQEVSTKYTPLHPNYIALDSQLQKANSDSVKLNAKISALPQVQQEYIRFERDVDVYGQLYANLLNNAQQLQIAKAGTIANVAIVDPPIVPDLPEKPKKRAIVLLGLFLGLLAGFIVCQLLAMLTGLIRDPAQVEEQTGLQNFAILPISIEQYDESSKELEHPFETHPFLLSQQSPNAMAVEALRSLRTSLLFSLSEKVAGNLILVSSAVPGQGKSFISANLAYLIASTGKKVMLLEADIWRASMTRYLSYSKEAPGFSEVLKGSHSLDQVIIKDVFPNLSFIPSGTRIQNSGDLCASEAAVNLFAELKLRYDYVIVDSPPVLSVIDTLSLGAYADLIAFVVRQNLVSAFEVKEAVSLFSKAGHSIDGLIFNCFVPLALAFGSGYGNLYREYGRYGIYGLVPSYQARNSILYKKDL
ncbi:AAA family ATPase [Polynucleobacter wuianus]|uniref:GNVR domain-containing protein n=1 Tax=Polynucleobacter wuianus TaxID=1743168 RepID=UPI001C0CB2E9|nr:GNVR domain-containing protein [Polynucleobacter wuianus]MBU3611175.1 AAA family ATPase [Polynucleobacter wuianus]